MQKLQCFLDDVKQVYFSSNKNLKYELAQAFKCLGFDNIDENLTANDIDEMLRSYTGSVTNEVRNSIWVLLSNQTQIPRLKVVMEDIESSKIGFGSPNCAVIVDNDSVWFLIKEKPSSEFIELISKISLSQGVFLVDVAQGIIVDSRSISNIKDYFDYED